jgi:hypothetical protein
MRKVGYSDRRSSMCPNEENIPVQPTQTRIARWCLVFAMGLLLVVCAGDLGYAAELEPSSIPLPFQEYHLDSVRKLRTAYDQLKGKSGP